MGTSSTSRGRFFNPSNSEQDYVEALGLTEEGRYVPAGNTTTINNTTTLKAALDALDVKIQTLATTSYVDGKDTVNDAAHTELSKHIVQTADEIDSNIVDWDTAKHFTKTLSNNLEIFDDNLPEYPEVKEISMSITGDYNFIVPTYWMSTSATTYDGTKQNLFKVFCEDDTAVAKVDILTLTGTVGFTTIGAAGGLSKRAIFKEDLDTTAENFVTDNADTYLAEKIVITNEGPDIRFESYIAGYDFTSPTSTPDVGNLAGNVANTQVNVVAVEQIETVTISGTDGKVTILDAGSLSYDMVFNSDIPTSVSDFVTANAAAYLAEGIVITADTNDLVMTAAEAGTPFTPPTKFSIVGDLAGTVDHTEANVVAVAQVESVEVTGTSGAAIVTGTGGLTNTLVFNTSLSQTVTDFKTNNEAEYLAEDVVLTKVNAQAQVDTVTLTGTGGNANITGAGGLTKALVFNTSLDQTATDFVTNHAAAYLVTGIVVTSLNEDIIFTAQVAGTSFTHPVITNVVGDLSGSVVNTNANVVAVAQIDKIIVSGTSGTADVGAAGGLTKTLTWNTNLNTTISDFVTAFAADYLVQAIVLTKVDAVKQKETVTLTGASGTANITGTGGLTKLVTFNVAVAQIDTITLSGTSGTATIDAAGGLTKTATFNTDLPTTAADFVTAYAADYLAQGIVITNSTNDIVFTANVAGTPFTHPTIANASGDLAGVVVNTQANRASNLTNTAADFVTSWAADYLAQGVVVTSSSADVIFEANIAGTAFTAPSIANVTGDLSGTVDHTTANVTPKLVFTANVAGTGFTNPTITNTSGNLTGSIENTQVNVPAEAQVDTITLSGTIGFASITLAGGLTKSVAFNTSLDQTAADFVTDHAAAYLAQGIVVTSLNEDIIFTASVPGTPFVSPAISNVVGDLAGSVDNTTPNVTAKLIFTSNIAGTPIVAPVVTTDFGDLAGVTTCTQINVEAVAQVETITLTGTDGEANVTVAGGLTKEIRFNDSLSQSAEDFVTNWAADYLAQDIILGTDEDGIVMTAATAGTGFAAPVVTNVPWDMDASIAHTQANVVAVKQKDTLTLTGTGGDADVTATGGLTKRVTFDSSLTRTAEEFVTNHETDYLAQGVVVTSDTADIIFEASVAGTPFSSPVINNVAGDLDGTVENDTANVSPKVWYEIKQPI